MTPNQEARVLIQMQQGENGLWDVNEVGFDQPLASFADIEQCVDYASDVAKARQGIIVQSLN
ncbi:MAG: hypothetical protein V4632_20820 [Pseudomonadota bacterium]